MPNGKPDADFGAQLDQAQELTRVELAIANALISGQKPSQIAVARGIAVGTVRVHIRNIFNKLDIHSVNELFALVLAHIREPSAVLAE
jgi:DNA-binding CsgD family transcriptional regulator